MAKTLAKATAREKSGCFSIGSSKNLVEECHVHFRHAFSSQRLDDTEDDDQSDDENQEEAIDWGSLAHFGPNEDHPTNRSTLLLGFRLQSGVLVLLRASRGVDPLMFTLLIWYGTQLLSAFPMTIQQHQSRARVSIFMVTKPREKVSS